MLKNEFEFLSVGDSIELSVGNETLTRLSIEDETQWTCIMTTQATDYNGFFAYSQYQFSIWKVGGVAYVSDIKLVFDNSHDVTYQIQPAVDVITDTTQHRFSATMIAGSSFPTPKLDIVSSIQYIQSR